MEIKCPHCKNKEVIKRGYFTTAKNGKTQRYFCKSCNKKFVPRNAFYRMRNSEKKITLCLDLFYRGVSTRKIQEHLRAFYPHNSDHTNIYRWIIKYSNIISTFTDSLKLQVGKEMQIDEVRFNRRKHHRRKGAEVNWSIDSIDSKTRFMVSSAFTQKRDLKEIKQVLSVAKKKTENQFEIITSDGWRAYPDAIRKVWGFKNRQHFDTKVIHNKVKASKGEGFNILIERLHNNLRHRTKTFRGFHGSVESANTIMKGWAIYYNFITKHQAIKCCPYQLATDLKLNSENKWLELINMSPINDNR